MKNSHYDFLVQMQSNLHKLYETFDYEPEKIILKHPNGITLRIEAFLNRGRMADYIDSVNVQIKNATQIADSLRIDKWSLKEELEEYKKRVAELESCSSPSSESSNISTIGEGHDNTKKENYDNLNMELVQSIISLYDNQIIKCGFIKQQDSSNDLTIRVVESVIKELESMFINNGVEIIDNRGEFSGETQMIVDTKDTDIPELAGTVCDTVRVGFRYGDVLLRAQEVIVYTLKGE